MRKILVAVATLLFAGSVHATTLPYTGALTFQLSTLPGLTGSGTGSVVVNLSVAGTHLSTLAIAAGEFGPVTASLPVTSNATINSVIFTAMNNAAGIMTPTGGDPGPGGLFGGPVGLTGTAKICLKFAICQYSNVTVPLTGGFGVGGVQINPGAVAVTMQHNPWTTGQPAMTLHTAGSTISVPTLPGGFAHGPNTGGLSSAAQIGGVLQLVTTSKTYTSLTGAFPELPLVGILQINFVPEPGTLLLLASGVVGLAVLGRKRSR